MSQAALGRGTGIHNSDLVAVINELVRGAWASREPDPAGLDRLRALDGLVDEAQDELLAPLSTREREELVRLLCKIEQAGRQ